MSQAQQINPPGANVEYNLSGALLNFESSSLVIQTAADCVRTFDADPDRCNVCRKIFCSYSAAPAAPVYVSVKDGITEVWRMYLSGIGPYAFDFDPPLSGSKNSAMVITLQSGGGTVIGTLYPVVYRQL